MGRLAFDFSNRSVIITGAARGIGFELARRFAAAGATTWMVDADADALGLAAEAAGGRPLTGDVSSTADVERIVAEVVSEAGTVDVLVNNAGIVRDAVVWKITDEDWDAVVSVHLGGAFRFTRACVPHFRERGYGRVVNVTSYTGLHGNFGQSAYAAAKAGVIGFTKTTAKELARFGVTVNAISPNAETAMTASIPSEVRAQLEAVTPIGRFGDPAEIWPAVGFLASEDAGYVTGVVLPVDGGLAM